MKPGNVSTGERQYIICCTTRRQLAALLLLGTGLMMGELSPAAEAQSLTPDPGSWRPMSYADLQRPSQATATYTDIWKDAIEENNRNYRVRGDKRFAAGNAPVTEAHFVIWSSRRSVVLSALNTATACEVKSVDRAAHVTIKLCPLRMAIYEGLQVRTMEAGRACFLEPEAGSAFDPAATAAYGSYDVPTRTVKIGLIVNHAAVDGCSFNVPLR
ncbi:hypothetical protein JQ593_18015 [Bradyrhizobium viridifuturi]|nr:hypothetical protein [Bradyrhizobium viridifuturi]MBR1074990.1 hypothetical protein [Bradyrhizobium viridifuturi]